MGRDSTVVACWSSPDAFSGWTRLEEEILKPIHVFTVRYLCIIMFKWPQARHKSRKVMTSVLPRFCHFSIDECYFLMLRYFSHMKVLSRKQLLNNLLKFLKHSIVFVSIDTNSPKKGKVRKIEDRMEEEGKARQGRARQGKERKKKNIIYLKENMPCLSCCMQSFNWVFIQKTWLAICLLYTKEDLVVCQNFT